jgi:hypothetical protein
LRSIVFRPGFRIESIEAREYAVSEPSKSINDNFMAMVSAKAEVTLPLSEFQPQSTLVQEEHHVERARFPAIDYHNHLDALDPVDVLRVMDACGIERMVNITMLPSP